MVQLRLLASSLLASEFVLTAAAQSPTPQPSAPPATAILSSKGLTAASTSRPYPTTIGPFKDIPALRAQEAIMAHRQSPCFTLRSYNFTERDLKSAHPHFSSETDCTPASKGRFLTDATSIRHSVAQPGSSLQPPPHQTNQASHN